MKTSKAWPRLLGLMIVTLIALPASTLADPATPVSEPGPVVIDQPTATDIVTAVPTTIEPPAVQPTESPALEEIATATGAPTIIMAPTVANTAPPSVEMPVHAAAAPTLYVNNQTGSVWLDPFADALAQALPPATYQYVLYPFAGCTGTPLGALTGTRVGIPAPRSVTNMSVKAVGPPETPGGPPTESNCVTLLYRFGPEPTPTSTPTNTPTSTPTNTP
ncbi:MAG: hypothetical protein WBA63_07750, partial [Thermomicrobiales bacterium]